MATITFRLADTEKADLETAARREGLSVGAYIRQTLALRDRFDNYANMVDRRLEHLEQIAGL